MSWPPITAEQLDELVDRDLADCPPQLREFFERARIPRARWRLSPWGDASDGFWVIARWENRVLWYNDIEDGFNVSRFERAGEIPTDEYWCNSDPLEFALPLLRDERGQRLGPPQPIPDP